MKTLVRLLVYATCLAKLFVVSVGANEVQFDGDVKYRIINTAYPNNSLVNALSGDNVTDHSLTTRLNLNFESNVWSAEASYQLAGLYGDTLDYLNDSQPSFFLPQRLPDDDLRLFDLSDIIHDGFQSAVVHRLDRFNLTYQNDRNVVKIGRQAVSWGNGLVYTPMDFFNPFDPSAVDTEYKSGQDMLYAQHLFLNGDDLQFVSVARRDENQSLTDKVSSIAIKYHGFIGTNEFDLLVSEHFGDTILGIGATVSIGGSVVRGDWVVSETKQDRFNSVVANISYSWIGGGKNMTGSLEYFHNGFGAKGDLSVSELAAAPELVSRLNRGELFNLGRDYLAGSLLIEMAPLWQLSPNYFYNLSDQSSLLQIISQHDISQNIQLVGALLLPFGSAGTEYGGFVLNEANAENSSSESDWSLFAQLAWYF